MRIRSSVQIVLFICVLTMSVLGQSSLSSVSNQDIYKNFLGSWDGSSERIADGHVVRETIELTITEEPNNRGIRMDYVYKGKTVDRKTRFLEILPEKHKIKMHFNGESVDTYSATGLTEFGTTGMGDFACYRNTGESGDKKTADRVTFHLDHDNFKYEWALGSDGKDYNIYPIFIFKRRT